MHEAGTTSMERATNPGRRRPRAPRRHRRPPRRSDRQCIFRACARMAARTAWWRATGWRQPRRRAWPAAARRRQPRRRMHGAGTTSMEQAQGPVDASLPCARRALRRKRRMACSACRDAGRQRDGTARRRPRAPRRRRQPPRRSDRQCIFRACARMATRAAWWIGRRALRTCLPHGKTPAAPACAGRSADATVFAKPVMEMNRDGGRMAATRKARKAEPTPRKEENE